MRVAVLSEALIMQLSVLLTCRLFLLLLNHHGAMGVPVASLQLIHRSLAVA